jgi:glutathione-regulated potassium-efflux system ancillary protein KefG
VPRILILFAHPALEKSRIHRRLAARVPRLPGLTFHDLYEAYPDFDVDVPREQALLAAHDLVVLQHPFFWYSTPPLLKQWIDLVLEHGWAYGAAGTALRGKAWLHLLSAGGRLEAYQRGGHNRFTIRELLAPCEQTARLCGMTFLPPYAITGAHRMQEPDIERAAARYDALLHLLHGGDLDAATVADLPLLNEAVDPRLDAMVPA